MINIDAMSPAPISQTGHPPLMYFRFRRDIGHAIQQVEYDLLQSNLNFHRGVNEIANHLCGEGYWAVVATSEHGSADDAAEYTRNYLLSMPAVDPFSISLQPPAV